MTGRGVRGRAWSRRLLALAAALVTVTTILILAAPNTMGPEPEPIDQPLVRLGLAAAALGLVWMIRIDRAARDPERHTSDWRSQR